MATRTAKSSAQRQNQLIIFAVFGLIAIVAVVGLIVWNQNETNKSYKIDDPKFAVYAGIPLDDSIEDSNREIEEKDDVAEGVVQGVLEDGTPFIGSLNAPVVIADFSDFSCPHCATYKPTVEQIISQYVRSGQLRVEFRAMTFVGAEYSRTAASAALCAADQGAFWEFHSELFRYQETRGAQYFTRDNMESLANDLGLDGDELRSCMASNRPERTLRAATQLQSEMGINSTPSLIYRANDSETWSRFYGPDGQPTIPSIGQVGQVISSLNAPAEDDTTSE